MLKENFKGVDMCTLNIYALSSKSSQESKNSTI